MTTIMTDLRVIELIATSMMQSNNNPTPAELADILRAIPFPIIYSRWLALSSDVDIAANWSPLKMIGAFDSDSNTHEIIALLLDSKAADGSKVFADIFALLTAAATAAPETGCLDLCDITKWTAKSVEGIPVENLVKIFYNNNITKSGNLANFRTTTNISSIPASTPTFGTAIADFTEGKRSVLEKIRSLKPETSVKTLIDNFGWQIIAAAGISKDTLKLANISVSDFVALAVDATITNGQVVQNLFGFPAVFNVAKSIKYPMLLGAKFHDISADDLLKIQAIKNAVLSTTDATVLADFTLINTDFISSKPLIERLYGLKNASGVLGTTLSLALLTPSEKLDVNAIYNAIKARTDNGIAPLSKDVVPVGFVAPLDQDLKNLAILKSIKDNLSFPFDDLYDKVPEFSATLVRNFKYVALTHEIKSNGIKLNGSNAMNVSASSVAGSLRAANYLSETRIDDLIKMITGPDFGSYLIYNTPAATTLDEAVANLRKLSKVTGGLKSFLASKIPTPNKTITPAETVWAGSNTIHSIAVALLLKSDLLPEELLTVLDFLGDYTSEGRESIASQLLTTSFLNTPTSEPTSITKLLKLVNLTLDHADVSQVQKLVQLFGDTIDKRVNVIKIFANNASLSAGQDDVTRVGSLLSGLKVTDLFGAGPKPFGAKISAEFGSGVAGANTSAPVKVIDIVIYHFRNSESDMKLIKDQDLCDLPTVLSFTITKKSMNFTTGLFGLDNKILAFNLLKLRNVWGNSVVENALNDLYTQTTM